MTEVFDSSPPTDAQLLARLCEPLQNGAPALARARALFGDLVWIRDCVAVTSAAATVTRGGKARACERWPSPSTLRDDDELVVEVAPDDAAAYLAYLHELDDSGPARFAVAPTSPADGATFKLWLVACARLVLGRRDGTTVHIEARHDRLGLRLAQVALAFGADVLAGPLADERHLPLAGVTRPTENSRTGLEILVQQADRRPRPPSGAFA